MFTTLIKAFLNGYSKSVLFELKQENIFMLFMHI